jgi:hypothetical protein
MFNETMFSFARIFYDAWLRGDFFFFFVQFGLLVVKNNQIKIL